MKTASICTIGDEILIGQIVDTNSSHIARELNLLGIQVKYMTSIGDDRARIIEELGNCLDNTDIVIVTGGLGPTKDDITKDALRELSGAAGYKQSDEQLAIIERILGARGIPMLDSNRAQALVPESCTVIPNKLGTAPCMAFYGLGKRRGSALYSLPGVPFEAIGLLPDVMVDIRRHFALEAITHHTIVTFGIAESTLAKRIEAWEDALPENIHLAYLPNPTVGVRLRLTQFGGQADFTPYIAELQKILGDANLSELITSVAGCSDYYKGSVTSYSNEVKMKVLGVRPETLAEFGAVSEPCVREMAAGVLRALDTDYAVATSGIAGPGGGTPTKPVGTAWLAAAKRLPDGTVTVVTECVHFASSRAVNIERFASHALDLLRRNM